MGRTPTRTVLALALVQCTRSAHNSGDEERELLPVGRDESVVEAAGVERAAAGADGQQLPAGL